MLLQSFLVYIIPESNCMQTQWPHYDEEKETVQQPLGFSFLVIHAKGLFQRSHKK